MSEGEARKLVLIRGIFLHGCAHANSKDEISRVLAVHHFDFSVEMMLKCIAVKHNIASSAKQEFKFKDLWNEITKKGIKLPLKSRMFELHEERNLVQHAGIVPSLEDVVNFKGYVESFLEQVAEQEFEISFKELSLTQLIENDELRKIVQKAENLFENEKYKECILKCNDALIKASFDVADIFGKAGALMGYFGAGEELKKVIDKKYAKQFKEKEFYILAKNLSNALLQLGQASTSMQFLEEFKSKFIEFRELVDNLENIPKEELREKARFSIDFITSLILKWQEEGLIRPSEG